jgi:hypothetical protein
LIGKPVALIQVPNQRFFSLRAAAQYLGVHPDTLVADTEAGLITAYEYHGRRCYRLEDLDRLIEARPEWDNRRPPQVAPAASRKET